MRSPARRLRWTTCINVIEILGTNSSLVYPHGIKLLRIVMAHISYRRISFDMMRMNVPFNFSAIPELSLLTLL